MSQENVELVRRGYGAWFSPDPDVLDAFFREHAAPDFEYRSRVLGRVFRGLDGLRSYTSELREIWGDFDLELLEYIDLGDHVMSVSRLVARGVASGVPIDQPIIALWTIKDSKLARATLFASKEEALEAAGLGE
jgi:ketosteroid isomerase-like protein